MAKITGLTTQTSEKVIDPIAGTNGTTYNKRAVAPQTGILDNPVADQGVATNADDTAFVAGQGVVAMAGLADDTSPDSVDEGDVGLLRMTVTRKRIHVSTADGAAITSVASQDTNITILAANVARIGATIFNNDTGVLYLKFGATATATTSNTVKLAAGGYYELPAPVYRGIIDGIWVTSGTGSANVTELT